jgi:alpha-mannosidase II
LPSNPWSDFKPVSHWSIDPFGLSPTIAYVMRLANISDLVLQRVHFSVKKQLAMEKQLEFKWRQLWSTFTFANRVL